MNKGRFAQNLTKSERKSIKKILNKFLKDFEPKATK